MTCGISNTNHLGGEAQAVSCTCLSMSFNCAVTLT